MNIAEWPMSEREIRNAQMAYEAAAGGMVLLRNENHTLPLKADSPVALFGNGAVRTVRGGTGSGDPFNAGVGFGGSSEYDVDQSDRYHIHVRDALAAAGVKIVNSDLLDDLAAYYDKTREEAGTFLMGTFRCPERELSEGEVLKAAESSDTAVFVLSRNSGESSDRKMTQTARAGGQEYEAGDYQMAQSEKHNLALLRKHFGKLVVVLNVGGIIDISEVLSFTPDAILLMGLAGQEGGRACADILLGNITPGGKLTDTWAAKYSDYPASATFADNDGNHDQEWYREGIYVGYRWFDTFGIDPVYEFGYGLSYTDFDVQLLNTALRENLICLEFRVKNTGTYAGTETVQVYSSLNGGRLPVPVCELRAYHRTVLLKPAEEEVFTITVPVEDLRVFSEADHTWLLQKGTYVFSAGVSSRNRQFVCALENDSDVIIQRVNPVLPVPEDVVLDELKAPEREDISILDLPVFRLEASAVHGSDAYPEAKRDAVTTYTMDPGYTAVMPYEQVKHFEKRTVMFDEVLAGTSTMEEFLAQLSTAELAAINCGMAMKSAASGSTMIGAASRRVPGAAGETSDVLLKYGVPSIVVADGPAGIRVVRKYERMKEDGTPETVYHLCTAWPSGTLIAQSFDEDLCRRMGMAIADELQELGIAILLGPGMNIHRDPLCGRNFEYYSEDPLISGRFAAAETQGVQSVKGCGTCIKHYAANNQETNRNAVDEFISERTLREIYLRGFEIAVKESQPLSIMSSYNKINHVPTADSRDLCTEIARNEWGYEGLIMTDWGGGSSIPSVSMHAGNDLIMPGGEGKVMSIVLSLERHEPDFDERGQIVFIPMSVYSRAVEAQWKSFRLDPEGDTELCVKLGEGHHAEIKDHLVLTDGEVIYTKAADRRLFRGGRGKDISPMIEPLTDAYARVSENGDAVIYRGRYVMENPLCIGDLQACAARNLRVIMKTMQ